MWTCIKSQNYTKIKLLYQPNDNLSHQKTYQTLVQNVLKYYN